MHPWAALGLTRRTGLTFALLMTSALAVLGYAGWRIGSDARAPAIEPSPTASLATVAAVTPPPCDPPPQPDAGAAADESARPEAADIPTPVFVADRFVAGSTDASALTYLGGDRTLLVGRADDGGMSVEAYTLFGDRSGIRRLDVAADGGLAADRASGDRVFALDRSGHTLQLVDLSAEGSPMVPGGVDVVASTSSGFSGMDIDVSTSSVVLVDPAADRLLRVRFGGTAGGEEQPWEFVAACAMPLPVLGDAPDVLLAARPGDGALFLSAAGGRVLYELGPAGDAVATYDLSSIGVLAVRGLAFAPSVVPGEAGEAERLYVLDEQARHTEVVAVAFEPPAEPPADVPTIAASVVQSIDLAALDPPSSDPGGVAYDSRGRRVIVTDSDIDELPEFAGSSIFARGPDGTWQGLGTAVELDEVTDLAIDAAGNRWFFSDDSLDLIVVFDLGPDATFGTGDDRVTRIPTSAFGNADPEGLTFGQQSLFVTDGDDAEIYRLSPGENGRFDGIGSRSDDSVTSFDTAVHGVSDPEGIAFDPAAGTLYVLSRRQQEPIIEVGTDGRLIRRITLPEDLLVSPGGIAMLPVTESGNLRLLIADRGADNARSVTPNDGRLIEIEIPPSRPAE